MNLGKVSVVGFAVAFALAAMTSSAKSLNTYMGDGNSLLVVCTLPQGTSGCIAYLSGVVDTLAVANKICVPHGVVTGQIVDIVVNYLKHNPADRELVAAALVESALVEVFPCRR